MISLDKTLLLQMVNFLVLLWILNRFLYKPILDLLEQRRGRIRDSEQRVQELEAEAEERWRAYQRQLQEAKLEANAERERIKAEGMEAERRLLEEVRAEAAQRVEEARRRIEEEAARARDYLRKESELLALQMAEKILGRSLQ